MNVIDFTHETFEWASIVPTQVDPTRFEGTEVMFHFLVIVVDHGGNAYACVDTHKKIHNVN